MSKPKRKTRTRSKTRRPRGRVYQIKNPTCVPGPEAEETIKMAEPAPIGFDVAVVNVSLKPLTDPAVVPMKRVSKTVRWPATWWQHFKHDLFPISWQLRWPVHYEELTYWTEVVDRGS